MQVQDLFKGSSKTSNGPTFEIGKNYKSFNGLAPNTLGFYNYHYKTHAVGMVRFNGSDWVDNTGTTFAGQYHDGVLILGFPDTELPQ